MKKYKLVTLGLVLSIGAVLGIATVSQAKWSNSIQSQDKVEVAVDQTHQGSLYATGDQVTIEGTIEGDLYCAARELVIGGEAEVTGDVLCAVQTATIDGKVGQDLRLAGQYISVDNTVGGSLTFFGQDLKLRANSSVAGDVNGAGQIMNIGGPVGGDIVLGGERLSLQSTVAGNVDAGVNRIEMTGGAEVKGDLNYSASQAIAVDESKVAGEISSNQAQHQQSQAIDFGWLLYMLLSMLACALLVALLAPRFVERSQTIATRHFATVSLIGFAVVFGTPIVAVMAMVTVVLLPVGIFLTLLWASALLLSHGLFAYWLGTIVLARQENVLLRMTAGVGALFVLYLIPLVNFLVAVVATVVGSGMLAATALDGYQRPAYNLGTAKKGGTVVKKASKTTKKTKQ